MTAPNRHSATADITAGDVLGQAIERGEFNRLWDYERWELEGDLCFECLGRGWVSAPDSTIDQQPLCPRCFGMGKEIL